jgi:hypothetical protein
MSASYQASPLLMRFSATRVMLEADERYCTLVTVPTHPVQIIRRTATQCQYPAQRGHGAPRLLLA